MSAVVVLAVFFTMKSRRIRRASDCRSTTCIWCMEFKPHIPIDGISVRLGTPPPSLCGGERATGLETAVPPSSSSDNTG